MNDNHIRVLLVEDNPDHACQIKEMLTNESDNGFDLEYADRLSIGLECLSDKDINVVLLDLSLPDSQGIDTFHKVHAQAPDVPIVVITSDNDSIDNMAACGDAQTYLVKDKVDNNMLIHSLRQAVERKRTEEELAKEHSHVLTKTNEQLNQEVTKRKRAEKALLNALEESRRRKMEISALLKGAKTILEYNEFSETARSIYDICKNLIGSTGGYVALLSSDETLNEALFLDSGRIECTVDPSLAMPVRGLRAEAYHNRKAYYENDFPHSEWVKFMPQGHAPFDNVLFAPLLIKKKAVGLLGLVNKPGGFSENDARLATAFGEIAAIALHNSQTFGLLANSEERYRSLMENIKLGVTLIDSGYNILMTNDLTGRLHNKDASELVGKKCFRELENRDTVCPHCPGKKAMITRLPQEVETESVRDDASSYPIWIRAFPILGPKGSVTGFVKVVEDITERKQAEEEKQKLQSQLIQAQKMESIGRLAGGVAHDFNNILFAINGFAELTLQKMDKNDPLTKNIESILDAGQKAADLTKQLLAFSRRQLTNPAILNLNTVIENTQKMLKRVIGENINMDIVIDNQLWNIKADHSQIVQIIMNLVVNASDAMTAGGNITIKTENALVGEESAEVTNVDPGEYVILSISDTGCGMSEEVKNHIFEPFYTTKDVGKGTGLGLATVYGIIKQSDGFISVYSEPEMGTTFKIYLPRVEEETKKIEIKQSEEMVHGTETILVVEDEQKVREIEVKLLSKLGYTVLEADDGLKALNICEELDGSIQLLLTDVVMPRMNGGELADKIKELFPAIKILYISGYTEDNTILGDIHNNGVSFLQKPISPQSIAL